MTTIIGSQMVWLPAATFKAAVERLTETSPTATVTDKALLDAKLELMVEITRSGAITLKVKQRENTSASFRPVDYFFLMLDLATPIPEEDRHFLFEQFEEPKPFELVKASLLSILDVLHNGLVKFKVTFRR